MTNKKDSLEIILTKKEFDEYYQLTIKSVEKQLTTLTKQYASLIDFYKQYRIDTKKYRVNHFLQNNILKYRLLCKKRMGFKQKGE